MKEKEMLEQRGKLLAEINELRKDGIDKLDAEKRAVLNQKLQAISELDAAIGCERQIDALNAAPQFKIPKDKEDRKYSLMNVMRAQSGKCQVDIGYEIEVGQELMRSSGQSATGVMVPIRELMAEKRAEKRSVTNTTEVAPVIGTDIMEAESANLYSDVVIARLGGRTITGLVNNIEWPMQNNDLTPAMKAETAANAEKGLNFTSVLATPHRIGGDYPVSMQTLLQNSASLEQVLMSEINATLTVAVENAAFNGTGAGVQVLGILNNPSLGSFTNTGGTMTWAQVISAKKKLIGIGLDQSGMGWALGSDAWAKAATTAKDAGSGVMVLNEANGGGSIAGYPVAVSDIIGAGNAIAGYWRNVYLQFWGGIDIFRNESSQRSNGMIVFNLNAFFDVTCTRPAKLLKNSVTIS